MSRRFVLIHSPLPGPRIWQRAADELRRQGDDAIVPDLTPALRQRPPYYRRMAEMVHRSLEGTHADEPVSLVGHSGAGALLPAIRERLDQPAAGYGFVDARRPKDRVSFFNEAPADLAEHLRGLAGDGWLPPWSEWFGEEAVWEIAKSFDHPVPGRIPQGNGW